MVLLVLMDPSVQTGRRVPKARVDGQSQPRTRGMRCEGKNTLQGSTAQSNGQRDTKSTEYGDA